MAKSRTNQVVRMLQQSIWESFNGIGGVNWLMQQAYENPTAYMRLLEKLLPSIIDDQPNLWAETVEKAEQRQIQMRRQLILGKAADGANREAQASNH